MKYRIRENSSGRINILGVVVILVVIITVFLLGSLVKKNIPIPLGAEATASGMFASPNIVDIPIPIVIPPRPTVIPVPTLKIYQPIEQYSSPIIAKAPAYTLIFVGDSMTESLGINFDDLRIDLKKY
jgi:hypothetical protein